MDIQYRSYSWVLFMVSSTCVGKGLTITIQGTITYAYQMNAITDALKSMLVLFRVTPEWTLLMQGVLVASAYFGALLGCLLTFVSIRQSLRSWIIILDLMMISGSLLEMSENLYVFLIGRLVTGMGAGLHSVVVPVFIKMLAPKQMYGSMAAIMQLTFALGYMLTTFLGIFLETPTNIVYEDINKGFLKFYYAGPSIFSLIRIVLMLTVVTFDPPSYYLARNENKKAEDLINIIYKEEHQAEVIQNYRNQLEKRKRKINLLGQNYRLRFFLALFVNIEFQFNGLPAVLQYSTMIFLDITDEKTALLLTFATSVFKSIFYFIGTSLQQRLGRRMPFLVGYAAMGTGLLGMTVFQYISEKKMLIGHETSVQNMLLAFMIFFMFANFNSVGFLGSVYVPELVPDIGVSFSYVAYWIASNLTLVTFPLIKGYLGMSWIFLFFAINCWLAEYILYNFGLETVNKDDSEIDDMFERLRKSRITDNSQKSTKVDNLLKKYPKQP